MNLFRPSENILEKICEDEVVSLYETYTRDDEHTDEIKIRLFAIGLYYKTCEFYSLFNDESKLDGPKTISIAGEAMKNCYHHGPKDKEILFGLFFGDKGVCYGFSDGGNYFKDKEIKYLWENKIEITEFDQNTPNNFRCGVNRFIFPDSDIIEVDIEKGILYLAQFKKSIISD
jgi:hypothetical protein